MKFQRATVTVQWGSEDHSITLTARNWNAIKTGRPLSIRGKGYWYEGAFFWDNWTFGGGLEGTLRVDYGKDGATGFDGSLSEATVEEH
jgi:hypothetical protein